MDGNVTEQVLGARAWHRSGSKSIGRCAFPSSIDAPNFKSTLLLMGSSDIFKFQDIAESKPLNWPEIR